MRFPHALVAVMLTLSAACGKPIVPAAASAPKAKPFERLDACRLIPNRWNDGDSFHVRLSDGREIVARHYFVDTIESETASHALGSDHPQLELVLEFERLSDLGVDIEAVQPPS